MPIDFLDIAPAKERRETLTVTDAEGIEHQVEIQPLSNLAFTKIAAKHKLFRHIWQRGLTADLRNGVLVRHYPAIIAAGLGHPGEKLYEEAAAKWPAEAQDQMAQRILAFSLPSAAGEAEENDGPLLTAAEILKELGWEIADSPPQSNS